MLKSTFENNSLVIYRDNTPLLTQPFKPTSTGERPSWANEQEALDWFINDSYKLVASEEELNEFIAALDSANKE